MLGLYAGQSYCVTGGGDHWQVASYASGGVLQTQPAAIASASSKAEADRILDAFIRRMRAVEV